MADVNALLTVSTPEIKWTDGINTTCLNSTCGNDGTCLNGCTDGWAGLFCEGKYL
jgi:hypothetical protein